MSQENVINRFWKDHKFLSNFHYSTIFYRGNKWKTVEHAYQAMKTLDITEQAKIRDASAPSQAKKYGRCVIVRDDWDQVKIEIMLELLRLKFHNPFLRGKLAATGNAILIEGNNWCDVVWGQCRCEKHNWEGLNLLGRLLMQVRDEINSELLEDCE